MSTIFDVMLDLPLFQGMTRKEFMELAEKVRFDFYKRKKGEHIVETDEPCNSLIFILSGNVSSECTGEGNRYLIKEWFKSPLVIQPERLFGLRNRYSHRFLADTDIHLLRVEKRAIVEWLFDSDIFRFNYVNIISTNAQLSVSKLWKSNPEALPNRFVHFLYSRCLRPAGKKELYVSMNTLAEELNTTRLNISKMLRNLEEEQKISVGHERIQIEAFEQLI